MKEEFHNHMRIPWHDYTRKSIGHPITEASLSEKASIIGRTSDPQFSGKCVHGTSHSPGSGSTRQKHDSGTADDRGFLT